MLTVTACSDEDEPTPEDPGKNPTQVELTLEKDFLEIAVGQEVQLNYTVEPSETAIEWATSDERIAVVDNNGLVKAIARGSATITAKAGNVTKTCNIKVVKAMAVGDFYYSDGTSSSALNSAKNVIGVIFWLGDPTADDPTLKKDHPECTHGLVVALNNSEPVVWQTDHASYNGLVNDWIKSNATEYTEIASAWQVDTRRNKIAGYNNTKAIEAFNAAQANSEWPVSAVATTVSYRTKVAAPEATSGWFLPGIKELTLLVNSEHDGDVFDFNNVAADKKGLNKATINKSLAKINGASLIGDANWGYELWSSTEWTKTDAYHVSSADGAVMGSSKGGANNQLVRCILAF